MKAAGESLATGSDVAAPGKVERVLSTPGGREAGSPAGAERVTARPTSSSPTPPASAPESLREREVLEKIQRVRGMPARFRDERITMAHGAGGRATATLVQGLFLPAFGSATLDRLDDAGIFAVGETELALTTDSFVVRPLRFPGGSIGDLAVNGTVNDLAVAGARPLALTLSLILEEGLPAEELRAEVETIARAAARAGVEIVAGDTKVVERGHADGMYICTTGLGRRDPRARLSPTSLRAGDRILISGTIAEHGTAIMLARGEFELDSAIESDTRSLWPAVDALLDAAGPGLRCMRDATRGGVASVLNELATAAGVSILVREGDVPLHPTVSAACEILGIDPMYVANEGKFIACVAPEVADVALAALRAVPGSEAAAEIGEVRAEPAGLVLVETAFGGKRVMDMLVGDPLPRIC
jgi:hydrogenase expression/formation protein HypE